jgi:hypothetical protein
MRSTSRRSSTRRTGLCPSTCRPAALLAPRTMDFAKVLHDAIGKAIAEAEEGRFWRPMIAVASLDRLHEMLAKRSDLAPLIEQMLTSSREVQSLTANTPCAIRILKTDDAS